MFDLRPVGYVIGLLVAALGATMLLPMAVDLYDGNDHAGSFFEAAIITSVTGSLVAIASVNGMTSRLSLQQTFLLTTGVWLALPVFGAMPFLLGATDATYIDAFFEAMSGLTTTGATVFSGLDELPRGLLLWRAMLQWFGGVGIIVVAMVFLPELRVGGMQIFRSEGFDTMGKILPRATEISQRISTIYITLTVVCGVTYAALGMGKFDAIVHAMTTIATGGFSSHDASFGYFGPQMEYAGAVFMMLAALPFVRYVQMMAGTAQPMLRDPQVRGFFTTMIAVSLILAAWLYFTGQETGEGAIRLSLFNGISILSGTGYASADYMMWGNFPVVAFFFIGLIGGCAGSTACSIKIFRYQLLFASIKAQVQKIHSPSGIFTARYAGRVVGEDVRSSVMVFFVMFFVSLCVLSILLSMTGLDFITSVSGAASALANIGPGLGAEIGPAGNFGGLNDGAKWILTAGMLLGRLELLAVFVLFTKQFWRQ